MTFVAPDPVSSGRPHKIVESAVGAANDLDEFVGEASFTIDKDGPESVIRGSGTADGTGVRFLEKDAAHSGKDVRAWHITKDAAGQFLATPVAAR
jgi:hypothetical protein